MAGTIKCPQCGNIFELTQALKGEIEQELSAKLAAQLKKEITDQNNLELTDLRNTLAQKDAKIEGFRDQELKLREEKRLLEDQKKDLSLEVERRLDEAKKKVEEIILRQAAEAHRLKDLEKDKVINDLRKSLDEAQLKAQQSSQQLQGEVLELDLENTLKTAFPLDLIEPVEKGIRGADIKQTVRSPGGRDCGVILWESKRTKTWAEEWLTKLKQDMRATAANVSVIVSIALPKECLNGLGTKDGVWVVSFAHVIPLAILIRDKLIEVARQKVISAHTDQKSTLLYEFVTSHEFRQQLEAMVEVYREMSIQIAHERAAYEKIWKTREAQAQRLLNSTANVCGKIQGLIGSSMLQVKGLDLTELPEGKKD